MRERLGFPDQSGSNIKVEYILAAVSTYDNITYTLEDENRPGEQKIWTVISLDRDSTYRKKVYILTLAITGATKIIRIEGDAQLKATYRLFTLPKRVSSNDSSSLRNPLKDFF